MSYAHGWADELRQACHDIRQPIAGVLALVEAALSEADLSENTLEFLDKIIGLAEWQSDVIEHWLWARDDWPSKTQETDVLGVITEAVAAQQATWAGDLTVLWAPGPVLVGLPRVTLRRMTANLLANVAREATEYNGRLECGRASLRGTWMSLLLPIAAPGKGGRITNAARAL